jgi:hypothetical protein
MSITITDPALVALLRQASPGVELKDADGNVLWTLAGEDMCLPPPGVQSPFTDADRVEMRKHKTGRPLSDILRDLEGRG